VAVDAAELPARLERDRSAVKGQWDLPGGGHRTCPVVAVGSARWRPPDLPGGGRGICPVAAT